jgi:two-component sensor histidine kinase
MRVSLDLFAQNDWTNVERLRTAVERCFLAATGDLDTAGAVALIAAELGENALKYGHWSGASTTFRLKVSAEGQAISVVVESPWSADRSIADLLDTLGRLASSPTPKEAVQARMRELGSSAVPPGTSRLGLLRLAYETGCTLRVEEEAELVRVIAELGT